MLLCLFADVDIPVGVCNMYQYYNKIYSGIGEFVVSGLMLTYIHGTQSFIVTI